MIIYDTRMVVMPFRKATTLEDDDIFGDEAQFVYVENQIARISKIPFERCYYFLNKNNIISKNWIFFPLYVFPPKNLLINFFLVNTKELQAHTS